MTTIPRRTAVVTGASAGIGLVVARELAKSGWRVIGVGRDAGRSAAAQHAIDDAAPGRSFTLLRADLSSMGDVRQATKSRGAVTRVSVCVRHGVTHFINKKKQK